MSLVQTVQTNGRALVTFFPNGNRTMILCLNAIESEVGDCLQYD